MFSFNVKQVILSSHQPYSKFCKNMNSYFLGHDIEKIDFMDFIKSFFLAFKKLSLYYIYKYVLYFQQILLYRLIR